MAEYIKARFVGGPKHNQVIEVERLPEIRVAKPPRQIIGPASLTFGEMKIAEVSEAMMFTLESYRLCRFWTGFNLKRPTLFIQYIHESLIHDNKPDRCTYSDATFPELPKELHWLFLERLLFALARPA